MNSEQAQSELNQSVESSPWLYKRTDNRCYSLSATSLHRFQAKQNEVLADIKIAKMFHECCSSPTHSPSKTAAAVEGDCTALAAMPARAVGPTLNLEGAMKALLRRKANNVIAKAPLSLELLIMLIICAASSLLHHKSGPCDETDRLSAEREPLLLARLLLSRCERGSDAQQG